MVHSFIRENKTAYNSAWVPTTTRYDGGRLMFWTSRLLFSRLQQKGADPSGRGGEQPRDELCFLKSPRVGSALTLSPVCLSMSDTDRHRRNCWLMIGSENCWVSILCGSFTANNILYSPIMTLHFLFSLSPFPFPTPPFSSLQSIMTAVLLFVPYISIIIKIYGDNNRDLCRVTSVTRGIWVHTLTFLASRWPTGDRQTQRHVHTGVKLTV